MTQRLLFSKKFKIWEKHQRRRYAWAGLADFANVYLLLILFFHPDPQISGGCPPPPTPRLSEGLDEKIIFWSKNKGEGAWPPGPLPWIRHCSSFDLLSPDWALGVVFLHLPCACLLSDSSLFLFPSKWENNSVFPMYRSINFTWLLPVSISNDCYCYQEKINDGMYVDIGYILIRQLKILFVIVY